MKARSFMRSLALTLLVSGGAAAQSKMDLSLPDLFNLKQDAKTGARAGLENRAVPMDAPLDPAEYTVGPGDLMVLNVWSVSPSENQLQVTPEGNLLVPNVGAINVRDLSLDAARKRVIPLVQKKYPGAEISLTLVGPRKLSVQISGQVMNEGMFEMSSVQRVDHLISSANQLAPTQMTTQFYYFELPKLRREASQRHIIIHRRDGTDRVVDLVKFSVTGKSIYDPYLRDGDMVYVPQRQPSDNSVGALGAFYGPTNVEFAVGDSVTDLVLMGYGLKPTADSVHAVLARVSPRGGIDTVRVDLAAIMAGRAPNIAIRPGDRLYVPDTPDPRTGDYVTVEGAVIHPGRYPIAPNMTRIEDVIRQAGGFAPDANPIASTLSRGRPYPVNVPEEVHRVQLASTRTSLPAQDSGYYLTETTLRLEGEMVSVDFRKLFIDKDTSYDVTLQNYDKLVIPKKQNTVYVFGQVLRPGHIPFVAGKDLRYYIDQAEGLTREARPGDIKVIKAGSKIWLDPDETQIEDGDDIWIPKEYHYPFGYYLTTVAQIAAILGTVATLIILAKTL